MTSQKAESRPNCDIILKRKKLWFLEPIPLVKEEYVQYILEKAPSRKSILTQFMEAKHPKVNSLLRSQALRKGIELARKKLNSFKLAKFDFNEWKRKFFNWLKKKKT